MDGPFDFTDGCVPNMDVHEIWTHVKEADARVYWELATAFTDEERADKSEVLAWLRMEHPVLFTTLEDILRSFQSAYHMGCEARKAYMLHYQRWKLSQRAVPPGELPLELLMEKAANDEGNQKKEKRRAEGEKEEDIEKDIRNSKKAAKSVRKNTDMPVLFYDMEPFTDATQLGDFRHFAKKGKLKFSLQQVLSEGKWQSIYHCNGPWNAEMLVEDLKNDGLEAIILKKTRGADSEVMGYKVLAGRFPPLTYE